MIPKFYCMHCKKFKKRREVSRKIFHEYLVVYECKWCHHEVMRSVEALEELMASYKHNH